MSIARPLAFITAPALVSCLALAQSAAPVLTAGTAAPARQRTAYYIDASALHLADLIPAPPPAGSDWAKAEYQQLHQIEKTRTPAQVAAAKADEEEEDMFVYKTVLGSAFNPESLPVTAALGAHVKNEQAVAGSLLKATFARPRPYQADSTLHPVCGTTTVHNSYPSGHALTGYLEALTLVQIVPEKRAEIMARADDYAHNRLVCGVHYPSDTEASRRVAYLVFGYMLATPKFQQDLAAARAETRQKLALTVQTAAVR